jgi:predicted small lipoprotein YifL
MRLDKRPRLSLLTAATALAIAPWALAACGNEGDPLPPAENSAAPSPTTSPADTTQAGEEGEQGAQNYFSDGSHMGEQVTVTATVDLPLNERSLVLNADDYGDSSLLVILEQGTQNFAEGDRVTATGTVKKFSYERYSDKYGLVQSAIYDGYASEEFLLGKSVKPAENPPAG